MRISAAKLMMFLTGLTMVTGSCELTDNADPTDSDAEKLVGQWRCDENSEFFKSIQRIYYVHISVHPDDSTKIIIENFYEVGDAVAKVSGQSVTLPHQDLPGGFTILSGSAAISPNNNSISWSYNIDDGSGDIDNVSAVYTMIYGQ